MKKTLLHLLAFTALLAGAGTLQADCGCFPGTDNFNSFYRDIFNWDTQQSNGRATMVQTGGVAKLVGTSPYGSGHVAWPWLAYAPFDHSWSAQVDVNLPMISLADGETGVGMGLVVRNADNDAESFSISLERSREPGQAQQFQFNSTLEAGGTTERTAPATATLATVRIVWNADTHLLVAQYDADGPLNGFMWTTLATFDPVNVAWFLDGSSAFDVMLAGSTERTLVPLTANVFADNFKAEPVTPRNLFGSATFQDGTSNTIQFGEAVGTDDAQLTPTDGHMEYQQTGAGEEAATAMWVGNTGSYTEDWEATVDLHVGDLAVADGAVRMSLNIESGGSVAMLRMGLDKVASVSTRSFSFETYGTGGVHTGSAAATVTDGSVRTVFVEEEKTLYFYYDATGSADGYSWTLLGSLDLDDGATDWQLDDDSRFRVWVGGESNVIVPGGVAWADNFRGVSDYTPPFATPPTTWEAFADNGKRLDNWAEGNRTTGNASLVQLGDGSVRFINDTVDAEGSEGWYWQANGSFKSSWSTQVDLHVPYVQVGAGGAAGMGIAIMNSGDANDSFIAALENFWSDAPPQQHHFISDISDASPETSIPTNSAFGSVRIDWNHSTKILTAYYDADGPANGYSWTAFRSFNPTLAAHWNMKAADTFRIALYGSAESTQVVQGHNFYADNFAVDGTTQTLLPVLKINPVAPATITDAGAQITGSIDGKGHYRSVYVDWGLAAKEMNSTVAAVPAIADGTSNTLLVGEVTGLQPHTKYFCRLRATSAMGTAYSPTVTFITDNNVPTAAPQTVNVMPQAVVLLPVTQWSNDVDGDALKLSSFTALSPASAGKLVKAGEDVKFAAAANFTGPATFTYKVKDAFGGISDAATVTLQLGAALGLSTAQTYPLPSAAYTYAIDIDSDAAWSVVESLPWLTVAQTSGSGDKSLDVRVQPNATAAVRTGKIYIGGVEHTVSQNGVSAPAISLMVDPPPPVTVGSLYSLGFNVTNGPVTFTVMNLPPGLKLDASLNAIIGRPTKAGEYEVTVKAKNVAGSAADLKFDVSVAAIDPRLIGTFHGYIGPHEWNDWFGGKLEFTISSTGVITGKNLSLGLSRPFTSQLQSDGGPPGFMLAQPGRVEFLEMEFNDTDGVFEDASGSFVGPAVAWRNPWHKDNKATEYAALHTVSLWSVIPDPMLPQGTGFGSFKPDATTGAFALAGKLPDGTGYTTSTFVGPDGQVVIYVPLYSNKGSLIGYGGIDKKDPGPADNDATAFVQWYKPAAAANAKDPLYPWGIDAIPLLIQGGAYKPVAPGGLVMNLDFDERNAYLAIGDAPLDDLIEIDIYGWVSNPSPTGLTNKITIAPLGQDNPYGIKMTKFDAATGSFSGEFTIVGSVPALNRKVPFEGLIVKDGDDHWSGYGFAIVPEEIVPPYTAATALRYSVPVFFGSPDPW